MPIPNRMAQHVAAAPTVSAPSLPFRQAGFRRLGKILFVIDAVAVIWDVVTTFCVVKLIPGGYEANGLMAGLMHAIGFLPVLLLRLLIGVGYAWIIGSAVAGRYRLGRAMFASGWWVRYAIIGSSMVVAAGLVAVVTHNTVLIAQAWHL
jgi:hypothetical protein